MKKLLSIAMLFLFTIAFAQSKEFTRYYLSSAVKYPYEKEFDFHNYKSVLIYNYNGENKIKVITKDLDFVVTTFGKKTVSYENGYKVQKLQVISGNDRGFLYLYDNPRLGCLFVFDTISIAFLNEDE